MENPIGIDNSMTINEQNLDVQKRYLKENFYLDIEGHSALITCMIISKDKSLLITGSEDKTIII